MQNYDLRNLIAADCIPVVLQRYPAVADRQRRCGTRRKTPQPDFRPRFSGRAARSPVDLLHDVELRSEFPWPRQRGDTVRLEGDGEPPGTERSKGPRKQSTDHVHVFACGRADAPPDFDYRLSRSGTCDEPGGRDATVHYHFIHRHGCGARTRRHSAADQFIKATIVIAIGGIAAVISALLVYI